MSEATITVLLEEPIARIHPNVYGHFAEHLGACIYEGIWVGPESPIPNVDGIRRDVVDALRRIAPPVLRWPGGCFADDYHWEDGVGPQESRPSTVNLWWGEDIETNAFGTHEFIRLCRLIGAEPYICGNVGSGSPAEMRAWVEYCNFPGDSTLARRRAGNGSPEPFGVRYWGVGNENWGCGGSMTPEHYGAEYRRYATYLKDLGGTELFLIACGPPGNNPDWTRRLLETVYGESRRPPRLHGLGAHYYCGTAGTATEYTVDEWYTLLHRAARVEDLVLQQRAAMDGYDPRRRVGLIVDEWGTWHPPSPGRHARHLWQQNTLRDGLVAALTLDTFNRHADKVVMANIAQTVNVLQAMILTEGPRMVTTPTFHVYEMYREHQGARAVRAIVDAPAIDVAGAEGAALAALSGSASVRDGTLTLSVVNAHAEQPMETEIAIRGAGGATVPVEARTLTHEDIHAHNTFDAPEAVRPSDGRAELDPVGGRYTFPPASVTVLRLPVGSR